jgi:hypothetical protein
MVKGEPESNALKYNGRYRRQIRNQLKIVSFSPSVFPRCALHLQRQDGWLRFVSMQDHYNLLARESDVATGRSERDPFANMHYKQKSSDRAIIDDGRSNRQSRGFSSAQIALAWLRRNPAVVAQPVRATKPSHLDDPYIRGALPKPEKSRGDPSGITPHDRSRHSAGVPAASTNPNQRFKSVTNHVDEYSILTSGRP